VPDDATLPPLNTEMTTFCDGFVTSATILSNPRYVISGVGPVGPVGLGGLGGFGPGPGGGSSLHEKNANAQAKASITASTINNFRFIFFPP
jgi:hypothetical protein